MPHSTVIAPYPFYYTLTGRFGRLNYLNALWQIQLLSLIFLICGFLISSAMSASKWEAFVFLLGLMLPFLLLLIRAAILRLHDLNLSGLWSLGLLLIFVPAGILIVSMILLLLTILPGSVVENHYGKPSHQGSIIGVILAFLTFLGAFYVFGMLFGMAYLSPTMSF